MCSDGHVRTSNKGDAPSARAAAALGLGDNLALLFLKQGALCGAGTG